LENDHSAHQETVLGAHHNDGSLVINFSNDDLEARADFIPPLGDGQHLSPDYISAILERLNIVYGVNWELIQESTLECNLEHHVVRNVCIARGDPVKEEVCEYFQVDPRFRKWPPLPDGDVPRIDWRELSPFIVVKKDQILASLVPEVKGAEGKDVHGNTIPKIIHRPESASSGKNTRTRADSIIASCDGRLIESGNELLVEEVLSIKGSVGYKTGHIVFPGDVIIDGPVADGFKVYSGGSIVTKQTFDATDVIAKKDLLVAGGLIGRGQASIKVGGMLRAKFIQNCHVACRGSISVGTAIVNSRIFTLEKLDLGDKGRIVGGELFSVHGIRAAGIGNVGGRTVKLHCGIDFTAQQELDRLNGQLWILAQKQTKLREMMQKNGSGTPQGTKESAALRRLDEEKNQYSSKISDLLGRLNADEEAVVEVSGEIAVGTLIEICHIALFVDKPLRKVRFKLDKKQGKLIHEPL